MDNVAKIVPERFSEGMTLNEFVKDMSKNREQFEENYRDFPLSNEDQAFLRDLDLDLNVVILAEDWCGDVLMYLPVFARLAEAARNWQVRVFCRDENPDLAEQWLKDGKYRSIPVIAFLDKEMREVACYVEKPAAVYSARSLGREQFAEAHPDLPDAGLPVEDMSDSTKALYNDYMRQLRADNRKRWQQFFVEEIKTKLQNAQREWAVA